MDKKRIIYIILFIIVIILIGYALYHVFFYRASTTNGPNANQQQTGTNTGLPTAGTSGNRIEQTKNNHLPTTGVTKHGTTKSLQNKNQIITSHPVIPKNTTQVVQAPVIGMNVDSQNNVRFYNAQDGKFYTRNPNGSITTLSNKTFYDVQHVTWSPTNNNAILIYPNGSKINYNFDTQKQVTLPSHWQDFSFSPTGHQIASESVGLEVNSRWLITSNPNGTHISLIEPLGNNASKVKVSWSPNRQVVATSLTGEAMGAYKQQLLLIGLHGENFRAIVVDGRGLQSQWSPNGKQMLYSVYNPNNELKPSLWIVNAEGNTIGTGKRPLHVNTWANKCAFDSQGRYVYCGVPIRLPTGAGFDQSIANLTEDRLYRIDTQTGLKTEIPIQDNLSHTIASISLDKDGKTLYFTDKNFKGVYKVKL